MNDIINDFKDKFIAENPLNLWQDIKNEIRKTNLIIRNQDLEQDRELDNSHNYETNRSNELNQN